MLGLDPLHLRLVLCVVVQGKGQSTPGSILLQHAQYRSAVTGIRHMDPVRGNMSHAGCAPGERDLDRRWCRSMNTPRSREQAVSSKEKGGVGTWMAVLFIRSL